MGSRSPTKVITQRLWSVSISRSSRYTPSIFMASTMASTLALSRPSEKLGTHSTSVDISQKNSWVGHYAATRMTMSNLDRELLGDLSDNFASLAVNALDCERRRRCLKSIYSVNL